MRRHLVLLACASFGVLAVPAWADVEVIGVQGNRFSNPDVTIAQGEKVTFRNSDPVAPHDVTAIQTGPDGRPLFASAIVRRDEVVPVAGAERLEAGVYEFLCSVHPVRMRGTLTVTPDRSSPVTAILLRDRPLPTLLKRGKIVSRVTLSEASAVSITSTARGVTLFGPRQLNLPGGTTSVTLTLTAAARRALRGRSSVVAVVTLQATDAEGNVAIDELHQTLTR